MPESVSDVDGQCQGQMMAARKWLVFRAGSDGARLATL